MYSRRWVYDNCKFSDRQDLYSWLSPDGRFISVGPRHNHVEWAYQNFKGDADTGLSPLNEAWDSGWYRVVYYNKTLYAHNDSVLPTSSQRKSLIDLAITEGMDEAMLDHNGTETLVWSSSDKM